MAAGLFLIAAELILGLTCAQIEVFRRDLAAQIFPASVSLLSPC